MKPSDAAALEPFMAARFGKKKPKKKAHKSKKQAAADKASPFFKKRTDGKPT